jgi:hypothetical protein
VYESKVPPWQPLIAHFEAANGWIVPLKVTEAQSAVSLHEPVDLAHEVITKTSVVIMAGSSNFLACMFIDFNIFINDKI